MYVKRALIAATEPPILPRWSAAAHAGGFSHWRTAAASARALARRSSIYFSLWQTAAAPRCSAALRCIIYSYRDRPLQQTAAAYQFAILFFSLQHTAAADCCSAPALALRKTAAAFSLADIAVANCCSTRGWALAGLLGASWLARWLAERWLAGWLIKHYSNMLRSSAAARAKTPGWPQGRGSSQTVVEQFSDLLRSCAPAQLVSHSPKCSAVHCAPCEIDTRSSLRRLSGASVCSEKCQVQGGVLRRG